MLNTICSLYNVHNFTSTQESQVFSDILHDNKMLPLSGGKRPAPTGDLAAGDMVKVALDPDDWKAMQSGHGEWNDLMAEVSFVCIHVQNVHMCEM